MKEFCEVFNSDVINDLIFSLDLFATWDKVQALHEGPQYPLLPL